MSTQRSFLQSLLALGRGFFGNANEDARPVWLRAPFEKAAGACDGRVAVEESEKVTYVFVHIPKTGGTTFQFSYLPAVFPKDERFQISGIFPQNDLDRESLLALPKAEKARLSVISGLNTLGLHEHFDNVKYISIARDPVEIAVSLYLNARYHDSPSYGDPDKSVPQYMREEEITLERFIREDVVVKIYGDNSLTVRNPALKSLTCGQYRDEDLQSESFLKSVVDRIDYFGITEDLDLFLFSLHVRLGLPLVLYNNRLTRSQEEYALLSVSGAERRLIEEVNQSDARLYRLVKERFDKKIREIWSEEVQMKWVAYKALLDDHRTQSGGDINKIRTIKLDLLHWDV